MNRVLILTALLALGGCIVERGDGIETTEQRSVSTFESVSNRGPFDMEVGMVDGEEGCSGELEVTCDSNLLDDLITEVKDNTLIVRSPNNVSLMPRADCVVVVYDCGSLRNVDNSGSGDLNAYGTIEGLEQVKNSGSGDVELGPATGAVLDLNNSGSGHATLNDLTFDEVSLSSSGSGGATASGISGYVDVHISGSGDLSGRGLEAVTADIHNSGSGSIELTVTGVCDVDTSGSGDVDIWGGASVTEKSSGSGDVVTH